MLVIDVAVITGAMGAIIKVVTGRLLDGAVPPLLWAVTMTL